MSHHTPSYRAALTQLADALAGLGFETMSNKINTLEDDLWVIIKREHPQRFQAYMDALWGIAPRRYS